MKALIYLTIIIIFLDSCKKPYDDPPVQSGISNLVVECTITNDMPPYIVKLTKSSAYNAHSYPTKVPNAKMHIIDDAGNVENVIEKPLGSGNYQTSATGMQGIIGRSYSLKISISTYDLKGKITSTNNYQSAWVTIPEAPTVDSVYGEEGQIQTLIQGADGSYSEATTLGLNMYIDAKPTANQDYYYKFKSSAMMEYTQIFYTDSLGRYAPATNGPPPSEVLYGWTTSDIAIAKDLRAGTSQYYSPINKYFIGFIPEFYSNDTNAFHDAPVSQGFITTTNIYSVSKKIYQIFSEENNQTKPTNSIFDPIPTQIETNIKCVNDTTQNVLGYFNAASIVHSYHFFLWHNTSGVIYSYQIDSLQPVFHLQV